jgi:bifunctional DNase/RNase
MTLLPAEGIALAIRLDVPIYLTAEAIITGTVANPLYEYSHDPAQSFLFVGSEIFE